MSDLRTAWTDVANKLEGLGQHLKARAGQAVDQTAGEKEALDDAVRDFSASVQNACAAVEDAVKDPEVKQQASDIGKSVVEALALTLEEVSQQMRSRLQTFDGEASAPAAVPVATPATPAAVEPKAGGGGSDTAPAG